MTETATWDRARLVSGFVDFEAFKHPVAAVPCPSCGQGPDHLCQRPSEHKSFAGDFHAPRKRLADAIFIKQHGEDAVIDNVSIGTVDQRGAGHGIWKIRGDGQRDAELAELPLFGGL